MDALKRFMAKVRTDGNGCWIWTGNTTGKGGYSRFHYNGRMVVGHRWSYEHHVGPIPDGLVIDHLCRTRLCVNPHHLEPVTNHENAVVRGFGPTAINARKTVCKRGHELVDNGNGRRHCPICIRATKNAYKERVRNDPDKKARQRATDRERERKRHHERKSDPAYLEHKRSYAREWAAKNRKRVADGQ